MKTIKNKSFYINSILHIYFRNLNVDRKLYTPKYYKLFITFLKIMFSASGRSIKLDNFLSESNQIHCYYIIEYRIQLPHFVSIQIDR